MNWKQAKNWRDRLQWMNVDLMVFEDDDFWIGLEPEIAADVENLWEAFQVLHAELVRQDKKKRVQQKKQRARHAVAEAVRKGKIHRPGFCEIPECGGLATEAHHPDYDRPLYVQWLCQQHHREAHRKDGL